MKAGTSQIDVREKIVGNLLAVLEALSHVAGEDRAVDGKGRPGSQANDPDSFDLRLKAAIRRSHLPSWCDRIFTQVAVSSQTVPPATFTISRAGHRD
jgi:hypothetical protein